MLKTCLECRSLSSRSVPSAEYPIGGSSRCSHVSCRRVTGISKASFQGFLGDTEGDDCEENYEEMIP